LQGIFLLDETRSRTGDAGSCAVRCVTPAGQGGPTRGIFAARDLRDAPIYAGR